MDFSRKWTLCVLKPSEAEARQVGGHHSGGFFAQMMMHLCAAPRCPYHLLLLHGRRLLGGHDGRRRRRRHPRLAPSSRQGAAQRRGCCDAAGWSALLGRHCRPLHGGSLSRSWRSGPCCGGGRGPARRREHLGRLPGLLDACADWDTMLTLYQHTVTGFKSSSCQHMIAT